MPQLSNSHRGTRFCPILDIAREVGALRAQGLDPIDLSVGIQNFKPAAHVYEGAAIAISNDSGAYGSSRGDPALIASYLAHLDRQGITGYSDRNVVIGLGGKHLLHCVIHATVEHGDEVVIPTPCWPTYFDIVDQAGGKVVPVRCTVESGYRIDVDAIERALTPRTRAVILNNPCNPTGVTINRSQMIRLARLFERHDIWVLSDDVYGRFVSSEVEYCHLLHVAPGLRDRLVKIDSVSKLYGMPGWRVGMLAAPEALADAIVSMNSNSISNIPQVASAAAAAALAGDQAFSMRMVDDYRAKRELVFNALSQSRRVICPMPTGAFYVFPDVSACFDKRLGGRVVRDDLDLSRLLLEQERVAVVPGRFFGESRSVRISCSADLSTLAEGARRILRLIDCLA